MKPHAAPGKATRRRTQRRSSGRSLALALCGAFAIGAPQAASAGDFNLPQGPGRDLIYAKCRVCHDLQYVVESQGLSASSWDGLLDDMEGFGVDLTADERGKILKYLSTYMGDTPPPKPTATVAAATTVDGKSVFMDNCTACHQEDAKGIDGTFPPLAGNNDLFLSQDFPAKVLLNGMTGAIAVKGSPYEGEMPPFDHLSDAELAAVINFLRNNFGNNAADHKGITPLSADTVKSLRNKSMTANEVLAYRNSLE